MNDVDAHVKPVTTRPRSNPDPSAINLDEVPAFVPHPWIKGGHRQTIAARLWSWPRPRLESTYAEVDVGGGDRLSVLESVPERWQPGDPLAIVVHGLGGCARSPYVVRVGQRLVNQVGARVVRMNLRGAGSGFGLSRSFYHSGRSDDLRRVAEWLTHRAPDSPLALIGFSLGANLVLKLAGESAGDPVKSLDCVLAANPPIDLEACCRAIQRRGNRVYDQNFVRYLRAEVLRLEQRFPELPHADLSAAQTLLDFDELYTAPQNGFRDALDYYQQSSSNRLIEKIQVPGLVLHPLDDPFIPPEAFGSIHWPPRLEYEMLTHGGHLGYWSHRPWMGDRRWLDSRIVHWLANRWKRFARVSVTDHLP